VEINVRPENTASLRVIQKLGFRYEGLKQRYIHINGDWRDHYVFALTKEDLPEGLLNIFVRGEVKPQKYPWN
jgi:ribosomal-protein-alanine N-acetyltransferase